MKFLPSLDNDLTASLRSSQKGPGKRETSELCRERAADDLLASVAMINAHQRARMETSAAMWTERAEMLQRVEDSLARRASGIAAKRVVIGDEPVAESSGTSRIG